MNIIADYHMHTHFSEDSEASMESMIIGSIQKGLKYICFTEHMDLDYPSAHGTFQANLDAYQKELLPLKAAYQDTIQIGHGVELGMQPHLASRNRQKNVLLISSLPPCIFSPVWTYTTRKPGKAARSPQ